MAFPVLGRANKTVVEPETIPLDLSKIPQHIAVIMDGNGRWAKSQGLMRIFGHREGIDSIRSVVRRADDLGVRFITLYAFSHENWKRPKPEVEGLMRLLREFLDSEEKEMMEKKIRLNAIGELDRLPAFVFNRLEEVRANTRANRGVTLTLALSYGSRGEIVRAVRALAGKVSQGLIRPEEIDEACIGRHLDTGDMPDPDLLIRTSGEQRISNFMLWQISYSEIYISSKLWPEFRAHDLDAAIAEYQKRERRFGR